MDFSKVFAFVALFTIVAAVPYQVEVKRNCEGCVLARCVSPFETDSH